MVVAGEVHSGLGHQGRQRGDEIDRLEQHVGRAVPIRGLQLIAHLPLGSEREPLGRHRRARNVATEPLELLHLPRLGQYPGVQGESGGLGHPCAALVCPGVGHQGSQGEGLAAQVRAECNPIGDGVAQDRRQGVLPLRLQGQVTVVEIAHQQTLALQVPPHSLAQRVHQRFQLGLVGGLHPLKAQPLALPHVHADTRPGRPVPGWGEDQPGRLWRSPAVRRGALGLAAPAPHGPADLRRPPDRLPAQAPDRRPRSFREPRRRRHRHRPDGPRKWGHSDFPLTRTAPSFHGRPPASAAR